MAHNYVVILIAFRIRILTNLDFPGAIVNSVSLFRASWFAVAVGAIFIGTRVADLALLIGVSPAIDMSTVEVVAAFDAVAVFTPGH